MADSPSTASVCPLCGGDNRCAIAAGRAPASCWCQSVDIDPGVRSRATDTAGERCLCPACGAPNGGRRDAE